MPDPFKLNDSDKVNESRLASSPEQDVVTAEVDPAEVDCASDAHWLA